MRFDVRALTDADAREIAGWRYAAPYDVYDETIPVDIAGDTRGLVDEAGALCAYFCWGGEARVEAAADVYARADALDFGIAMAPHLVGRGLGQLACHAALAWLADAYRPQAYRLAVYEWNARAQTVYRRLGFTPLTVRGGFLLMGRDERPWLDVTRPLENGMTVYHADPGFDRHLLYHKENCGWDMSVFSMSAHSGTHMDAPAHIGLAGDVDSIPLGRVNGAAQVLAWPRAGYGAIRGTRVLLRTGGRGLTLAEAQALVDTGVEMVGIDGMSVGEGEEEWAVHSLLLSSGVTVVENIALEAVADGWYAMRCLPLRMPGSDGAPVRLLLRAEAP